MTRIMPFLFVLAALFAGACSEPSSERHPEALDDADVAILDNMPEADGFADNGILLPDGRLMMPDGTIRETTGEAPRAPRAE